MAIAGLTKQNDLTLSRGFNQFGVIHKGSPMGKTKDGRDKSGRDLDYFRFDFKPEYGFLHKVVPKILGTDKVVEFDCLLVGDTLDEVFPTWHESWSAKGLLHQCDGITQSVCWDDKTNQYSKTKVPCAGGEKKPYECIAMCRRIGRLFVTIPAINESVGQTGVFILKTGSYNDVKYLANRLNMLHAVVGGLNFLPATIGRSNQKKSRPDKEHGRSPATFSLLYLNVNNAQIQNYVQRKTRLLGAQPNMLELVSMIDAVNQPQLPSQAGDIVEYNPDALALSVPDIDEDEDGDIEESAGVNPEAIAEWLQEKLNESITVTDVIDGFNQSKFDWQNAGEDAKLYAIAITLEYWHYIPESNQVNLDKIQAHVNILFPNSPEVRDYIMGCITE